MCTLLFALIFMLESSSCFGQYSLDDNPFGASEETEEEVEEIIDTRGVRCTLYMYIQE